MNYGQLMAYEQPLIGHLDLTRGRTRLAAARSRRDEVKRQRDRDPVYAVSISKLMTSGKQTSCELNTCELDPADTMSIVSIPETVNQTSKLKPKPKPVK